MTALDILVTKRLTLRQPLEVDAEPMHEILSNTDVTRMITGAPSPYSVDDALEFIQKARTSGAHFAIYRERLLGIVSIRPANGEEADLGFWLDPKVWGQGLTTEASRAVVSWYFRKFSRETITSGHYEDNAPSAAILEKLGFEPTGTRQVANATRQAEVSMTRMELTRARFESLYGPLVETVAA